MELDLEVVVDLNGMAVTRTGLSSLDRSLPVTISDHPSTTRIGEWQGVIELQAEETAKDAEWDEYLRKEWEERNDEYGFRCDFALKALHMHGPCFVYRPDAEGMLHLVDVVDPVTRKSLDMI